MKKFVNWLVVVSALLVFAACGGGGNGDDTDDGGSSATTVTGQFVDSFVSGLNYTCSSGGSDVTNANGEFTCQEFDRVEFFLGQYSIGSCYVQEKVTPYDLYPDNEEAAVNVAQLLQTLDENSDPSDGISIYPEFNQLDGFLITPEGALFDIEVVAKIGVELVSEEEAQAHLDKSIIGRAIVGGWRAFGTDDFLGFNFYEDGTYAHMEVDFDDPNETSGMEWGTYSVDEATGLMTVTQTFDNNGDTGLTDFVGAANLYVEVDGDVATFSFDEDGNGTIDGSLSVQRIESSGILGGWRAFGTDDFLGLNFYEDGTYAHMEVDFDDPNETSGMEWGTYSVDEATGLMTVTQTFDNNGDTGLTDFIGAANLYVEVDGDVATFSFDDDGNGTIDGSSSFLRQPGGGFLSLTAGTYQSQIEGDSLPTQLHR